MTLIFTIGTSNRQIEEFITILKSFGVNILVDVRRFPKSKFSHFNRENLEKELLDSDIKYIWMGEELGGYRKDGYEKYMETDKFIKGLNIIMKMANSKNRIIILCCEKLFFKCHRRFIARRLEKYGFLVVHIIDKEKLYSSYTPKIVKILKVLHKRYKLDFSFEDPFKCLITTILSQRTKDENTTIASKALFKKYDSLERIDEANLSEIKELIKSVGFYSKKAERIKDISRIIIKDFGGRIPKKAEELAKLPGVGRKTANCVLLYGFKIPAIPVDTHVHRIFNRITNLNSKSPQQTEIYLNLITPKKYWGLINQIFIKFGKEICRPINPLCNICMISDLCNFPTKNLV